MLKLKINLFLFKDFKNNQLLKENILKILGLKMNT